jgi:acetolactate synthase-1/3 small subunit
MKQLNEVVEVLKAVDLTETSYLDRETTPKKVDTKPEHRDEEMRIADIFRAKIINFFRNTHTIEVIADVDKVESLISMLKPLGIKEIIRTGRIADACEADLPSRRELQTAKA